MPVKRTTIISPSGKFYGSEQTLHSFLSCTRNSFDVFVNRNDGQLIEKLTAERKHTIYPFSRPAFLCMRLAILLLLKRYSCVYCNEGGYIRYLKLLARVFKNVQFVVHIRLVEDATKDRIGVLPPNLRLISVSDFIRNRVFHELAAETMVISSPVRVQVQPHPWKSFAESRIRVGVVGRVTDSKGLKEIGSFWEYLETSGNRDFEFHLYGDIEINRDSVSRLVNRSKEFNSVKVVFHGFQSNKLTIYKDLDIVVHFNRSEPLGAIFYESLTFGVPFVGFLSGGIGEIASNIGLEDFMISSDSFWEEELHKKILAATKDSSLFLTARKKMLEFYSVENYTRKLEDIILISNEEDRHSTLFTA